MLVVSLCSSLWLHSSSDESIHTMFEYLFHICIFSENSFSKYTLTFDVTSQSEPFFFRILECGMCITLTSADQHTAQKPLPFSDQQQSVSLPYLKLTALNLGNKSVFKYGCVEVIKKALSESECGNVRVSVKSRTLCMSGACAGKHPDHLDKPLTG